ncbi:MAG: hypothetical protein ACYDB0_08800, partial [Acidithiobacillus sp.]
MPCSDRKAFWPYLSPCHALQSRQEAAAIAYRQPKTICRATWLRYQSLSHSVRHPPSVKVMVDIQQSSPSQSCVWVLHLGYDREKGAMNGFWNYNPSPCRYPGALRTTVTYGKRLQFSRTTH